MTLIDDENSWNVILLMNRKILFSHMNNAHYRFRLPTIDNCKSLSSYIMNRKDFISIYKSRTKRLNVFSKTLEDIVVFKSLISFPKFLPREN